MRFNTNTHTHTVRVSLCEKISKISTQQHGYANKHGAACNSKAWN